LALAHRARIPLVARGVRCGVGILTSRRGGGGVTNILNRAFVLIIAKVIPCALAFLTGIHLRTRIPVVAGSVIFDVTAGLAGGAVALVPVGTGVPVIADRGVSAIRGCGIEERTRAADAIIRRTRVVVIARSADPATTVAAAYLAFTGRYTDTFALEAQTVTALGTTVGAAPVVAVALAHTVGYADALAGHANPFPLHIAGLARQPVGFGFMATCRLRRNIHIVILTGISRADLPVIALVPTAIHKHAHGLAVIGSFGGIAREGTVAAFFTRMKGVKCPLNC